MRPWRMNCLYKEFLDVPNPNLPRDAELAELAERPVPGSSELRKATRSSISTRPEPSMSNLRTSEAGAVMFCGWD